MFVIYASTLDPPAQYAGPKSWYKLDDMLCLTAPQRIYLVQPYGWWLKMSTN